MEQREAELGFAPQKEIVYNKLLPYADKIDEESNKIFAEIKENLAKSVALRDVKISGSHWVGQLTRYIKIYGLKFSKEDHVLLIKFLFELVIMPDLELSLVQKFAQQLVVLLKKKFLLSREDLLIPWRPLYKLIESVAYSPYEHHGLQLFPPNVENVLKNLITHCRTYFSVESTQEMLDEWRPLLCPFDVTNIKALHYFEFFLPTTLPPAHHEQGYKLWFQEFMDMWDSYHNSPTWESSLVNLFARLAHDTIGYIDWSPYLLKIFNRFLRSLNLPVGTQSVQVGRSTNTYDMSSIVLWIVSMLGGDSKAQDHVDELFKILQTFYYPSNLGRWNIKLSALLMTFPKLFIRRIHRERYKKPSWETPVPDSHKLSEEDITRFVESMKPVIFVSMFSRYGSQDSAVALRHLSNMRPELVVPVLLENMYPALENLTEPHRLIACMNCIVAVARPMLRSVKWYPEGRSHVLGLLNLALPGIDPNDFKKCLVTFQMISTFVSLVPIVDCSDAVHIRTDLTEIERELCSATAQFEDFVLVFLDRVFALIENSAQDHVHGNITKLDAEQSMLEVGLASTFTSVLQQCSNPVFESALNRLHSFVTGSVYEARVGGRFAANLCRAAAKVKPAATIDKFLPHFCSNIKHHIETHEDIVKEEHLDDSFLWNLIMLSQVVRCNGKALLPYKDQLLEVITLTLHLKCIQGYELAGQLLRYTLRALTLHYPLDYKNIAGSFDRPFEEYLAIRDWAKPGDVDDLGMEWHIPSSEELEFSSQILNQVLSPELSIVQSLSVDNPMQREELLQRLNVILECLLGAGSLLPMWKDSPFDLIESQIPLGRFRCYSSSNNPELTLDGKNVREVVVTAVRPLLSHMMESREDDTKGLFRLLRIYETILFFFGAQKNDFDARWKSFHTVKAALEDKMRRKKQHIRALLVDRVQLQHELRMLNSCDRSFTEKHKSLLFDLFTVSISRYGEVRKKAQAVLFQCFHNMPYSYRCIVSNVVENLKNPQVSEHQFKGALYIVLGNGKRNLGTKRSWEILGSLWPALVQAQHFEKPSILKVIDEIVNKIVKNVESPAIKTQTPDSCIEAAQNLLQSSVPKPSLSLVSSDDLSKGQKFEQNSCTEAEELYWKLVNDLADLVEKGDLMWKFSQIGLELLSLLLRHDNKMAPRVVQIFVKSLNHDNIYVRKLSTGCVSALLKQQKRKHKTVSMKEVKISGTSTPPGGQTQIQPGDRADNHWILYNTEDLPIDREKWEKTVFVEKTHWGYYCWPSDMKLYAPASEQPKIDRSREELFDYEIPIYDSLMDKDFVEKFVSYFSMEEVKGKDKFNNKHMTLFKGLFRNFGNTFLESFKPHVERLMNDTSHDKHDSSQRCAMEMLAGIIRGSKHWPYQQVSELWNWAIPIIKKSLAGITVETYEDWGTFYTVVSESRDPKKLYQLFELLLENPINGEGGSFGDTSRLYAIQNALIQQEWRVPQLLHRLLNYLQPHLSHQYKNVRDRTGSLLSNIFLYDYQINHNSKSVSPKRQEFIQQILPYLDGLKFTVIEEANGDSSPQENGSTKEGTNANDDNHKIIEAMEVDENGEGSEERKMAVRMCKTIMKWITNGLGRMFTSAPPDLFSFLPIMCTLESETKDDELKSDCSLALACFSQALIQPENIHVALATVKEVAGLQSWHAREAVLGYIQVMVFCNFFTLHQQKYIEEVKEMVLHLICDDQLEVREMASVTLGGLLHCGFFQMDKDMLEHFERLSSTKLQRRQKLTDSLPTEALIKRHAGVLGMSAFIQAHPYDVPDVMPQILMDLSNHVNDPQPIQMSVKKTLSNFRRTHHDNWHDHKQRFTDDQLVILTDLLVSPNYYA